MEDKEILSMTGIIKEYNMGGEISRVLKGIDLSVCEGEFLAVLGPSGSGKSTLMNIIGCLDVPTEGEYVLSGRRIGEQDEKTLAHIRSKEIGFIFQSFHLLQKQTALENVELPLIYAGVKKHDRMDRAREMLEKVGLGDKMDHFPNQMSGGQQQRVAIARALIAKPDVIFADEPTGNLDSKSGGEVMELLEDIRARMGKTLVIITHDSRIAHRADRQFVIMDGKVAASANTQNE